VRAELLEELAPAVLTERAVVVVMVAVMMAAGARPVLLLALVLAELGHLAAAAVRLEVPEPVGDDGPPLAHGRGALLLLVHRVGLHRLGGRDLDVAHHQAAILRLDELDVDARDAVDKGVVDLDDLEVDRDELHMRLFVLRQRPPMEAVS